MARPLIFAAAAAGLCASCMPGVRGVLPPEFARHNSYVFGGFQVAPIWQPAALRGYRTRIRMTAAGIALLRGSVSIDEHADGRLVGRLVMLDLSHRGEVDERTVRQFRVRSRDYAEVREAIARSRLWQIHPQYWNFSDPDALCIDGIEFIFERLEAQGYRFSSSNAQCTMPPDIRQVASKMFDIAGEPRLHRLLH